ncbi:uncharacterized protein LOC112603259 [Melanaphis sacchari]|uniref:uncharacterized protein LOC112603259 n=1 Tax=Melanaphis sacchari TaxID=742174 RepID=UPI000DC14816|nr:uncharacterized protein LOC112603259 [Melanaphis sacchari]
MRWTGFWIVPLVLGCCDAADVRPTANRNDDRATAGPPTPLGLRSVISRALSRVRESTRDRRLAGDLWLETVDFDSRARDGLTATPGSLPDDLVAQADAVFDNHQLSWRDAIAPGLDLKVFKDREQRQYVFGITRRAGDSQGSVVRTFGVGRRRMMFMLPVMYKLGVITTLLIGLVVLALKGVTIGVILLVIALSSIVAKLSKFHNPYASPMPAISAWSGYHHDPYDRLSQQQPLPPLQDKNIHVHVHTGSGPVQPAVSYAKSLPPPMSQLADDDDDISNYSNGNYYYNGGGGGGGGGGSGAYWNRAGEEYYNAATMNHYRLGDNHQLGAESTTASNSIYPQWLG